MAISICTKKKNFSEKQCFYVINSFEQMTKRKTSEIGNEINVKNRLYKVFPFCSILSDCDSQLINERQVKYL